MHDLDILFMACVVRTWQMVMLTGYWSDAGAALPIKEVVDIQHAFLESEALCGGCAYRGAR